MVGSHNCRRVRDRDVRANPQTPGAVYVGHLMNGNVVGYVQVSQLQKMHAFKDRDIVSARTGEPCHEDITDRDAESSRNVAKHG